jgi:hypothetical protein
VRIGEKLEKSVARECQSVTRLAKSTKHICSLECYNNISVL